MKAIFIALGVVGVVGISGPAQASSCGEKVVALEARFNQTHGSGVSGTGSSLGLSTAGPGSAAETTDAKLHHQPTESAVGENGAPANSTSVERDARFEVNIEQARAAADSGDTATCESSIAAAERAMRP